MLPDNNAQNIDTDIANMISDIASVMSSNVKIYQETKSSEIKANISYVLNFINQRTYSYILNINEFIRNNVKDVSYLKKALIEKIHGNMGD